MTDITKCPGTNCSLKETCYRFTAPSHEYRQSWFTVEPIDIVNNKQYCFSYWLVVEMKQAK